MSSTSRGQKSQPSDASSTGWRRSRKGVHVLVDRCLTPGLATALNRIDGVTARTLADVYGKEAAQHVQDEQFLREAATEGWVVFTKNPKMWRAGGERDDIEESGVHVFCIASGHVVREAAALAYGRWILSVLDRTSKPGPCFWRLNPNTIYKDCA